MPVRQWLAVLIRVDAAWHWTRMPRRLRLRDGRSAPLSGGAHGGVRARLEASAPVAVRAGGLVGMLDVPRLKLTTPVDRRRR